MQEAAAAKIIAEATVPAHEREQQVERARRVPMQEFECGELVHGGQIHVESEPGKGTAAVLRLPPERVLRRATAAQ